jgi:pimeloyl-ACP methyl ester carboxylesterase
MKGLLQLGALVAFGYAVLLIYTYFFQSRLVYFPNIAGPGNATPADLGLDYESVYFHAADGVRLHGWYVPATTERAVLLFLHGNAGNITHRLDSILLFHRLGLSTFIFDYRGYGQSEGSPTEKGTYADADAAWRLLVEERGISSDRVVIFGRSLGASIGTWLAAQHKPAALIVESVFTSAPDLAREHYWFLPVRALARIHYDTYTYMQQVTGPVLFLHASDDEIVPLEHGRRLYAVAPKPKVFEELQGGHNNAFFVSYDAYRQALQEFLNLYGPR